MHDAKTLHEQLLASATLQARAIRDLAPHVPPAVAIVIDRALELERNDRWASAREMQRAFRAARTPRSESDSFLAESLTLPAASLRHGSNPPSGKTDPGAPALNVPVPSSDNTLLIPKPPSDRTIQDAAPRTPQMLDAPSRTERITGTRVPRPDVGELAFDRTLASPAGEIRASVPFLPRSHRRGAGRTR